MTKNTDSFSNYSSKIKRVNVSLPDFAYFHEPSSEKKSDPRFVGREKTIAQLENWITDNNNSSGSYLITGYRGMGKTSLVGKVLNKIQEKKKNEKENVQQEKLQNKIDWTKRLEIYPFLAILIYFIYKAFDIHPVLPIAALIFLILFIINTFQNNVKTSKTSKTVNNKELLIINLNLGSEIKGERDVLSLISNSLYSKIQKFTKATYPKTLPITLMRLYLNSAIVAAGIFVYEYVFEAINKSFSVFYNNDKLQNSILYHIIISINDLLHKIIHCIPYLSTFLGIVTATIIAALFWKYVIKKMIKGSLSYLGYRRIHPRLILRKLKKLNDRIESAINEDDDPSGTVSTSVFGISFKRRRMRSYQPATVREIEQILINIFNDASSFANFIIVLDELDKIDPNKIGNELNHYYKPENEEELPEFGYDTNGFPGGLSSRSKKRNVLYLLAQMKYFISTVKTKFIFISGRELYDAYLADVSDREFSISSIFNGVINVDSFLTCENSHEKDITAMTEMYLCGLLFPKDYIMKHKSSTQHEILTLKNYYKYLIESNKENLNEKRNEIEKTILLLNQFVTYLTYVSNGAPKKITTHLEKFIITTPRNDEESINISPAIRKNDDEITYCLSFGYSDQQKIGFIHFMAFPIFQTIINQASEYSDKLLISSSFLISHIYKHHANGFSWRNLEYIPELIEIHRTPELRDFINSMITFLEQIYLTQINCGLYHIKFPKRITEEISILSKKYDEISAIFNFSLDDSRSVKQYYRKLLNYYAKDKYCSKHTLANLHVILGDLYLANEEYTEAICEFRNAIHLLSCVVENNYPDNVRDAHSSIHMMNQIRAMLKLGLAYEKRKTLDSAYLTYSELINKLIHHRYIDESKLELMFKVENTNDWFGKKAILYKNELSQTNQPDFDRKIHPRVITEDEKENIAYWMYGEEVIPNLSYQLTPEKAGLIAKLSLFEDLRLAYMPSLAKLFSIEKINMGGISSENLDVIESEFRYLHLSTNTKDRYIISADFLRKLGDILYYKNSMLNNKRNSLYLILQIWGFDIKMAVFDFCYSQKVQMKYAKALVSIYENDWNDFKEFIDSMEDKNLSEEKFKNALYKCSVDAYNKLNINNTRLSQKDAHNLIGELVKSIHLKLYKTLGDGKCNEKIKKCCERRDECFHSDRSSKSENIKKPCFACIYYNRSLMLFEEHVIRHCYNNKETIFNTSKSVLFLKALEKGYLYKYEENTLTQIAHTLQAMGNITFTCLDKKQVISIDFIKAFINLLEKGFIEHLEEDINSTEEDINPQNQLEKSILYFWTAAKYHKKASNLKESHQCYIYILRIFAAYISYLAGPNNAFDQWFDEDFIIDRLCKALDKFFVKRAIMRVYSNREYTNMAELQEIKWIFSREMYENINLNQLSLMPDIEEIIYTFYEIKISLYCKLKDIYRKNKEEPSRKKVKDFMTEIQTNVKNLYNSNLLNNLRTDSTIYSRVLALHFKSTLNNFILNELLHEDILKNEQLYKNVSKLENEDKVYIPNEIARFIALLLKNDNNSIKNIYKTYFKSSETEENISKSFIEFIVTDSMFCLSELLEILVPSSKTTLFTNSFIAGVYKDLQKWNKIYETLFIMYRWAEIMKLDNNKENKEDKETTYYKLSCNMEKYKAIIKAVESLSKEEDNPFSDGDAKRFFESVYNTIGKYNIHYTSDNYLAEMAIKRYTKAKEMHNEGQAYKDFITNFYILNDDLQNNTCQFYFAMERFKINIGVVDKRIKELKLSFKKSCLYDQAKYVLPNNKSDLQMYYDEYLQFHKP